jgi:hypothetical protein
MQQTPQATTHILHHVVLSGLTGSAAQAEYNKTSLLVQLCGHCCAAVGCCCRLLLSAAAVGC